MLRVLTALTGLCASLLPAAALVGGAPPAVQSIARHVVLIVGGGSACTGVAIAPDLVLTAAHCVVNGGKFRLASFEGTRPTIRNVANVAAHPQFTLRDDATFHDGSPVTAEDVVYSFQRLLNLGKAPSGAFSPVLSAEDVTAIDDRTVQFVLGKPYAPFLSALPIVAIVNQELVEANAKDGDWGTEWLSSNEAGSGAYSIDPSTYRPQEVVDLERNPEFFIGWGDNANPIDEVKVRPVAETSTRVLALM